MTVKELKEKLEDFDDNLVIFANDYGDSTFYEIGYVEVVEDHWEIREKKALLLHAK